MRENGGSEFPSYLLLLLGTCLSFSLEDKSLFVVGSENGGVFKCSLEAPTATIMDGTTGKFAVVTQTLRWRGYWQPPLSWMELLEGVCHRTDPPLVGVLMLATYRVLGHEILDQKISGYEPKDVSPPTPFSQRLVYQGEEDKQSVTCEAMGGFEPGLLVDSKCFNHLARSVLVEC